MPRFSQNFLVNKNLLPKIIQAADLSSQDIVVEIGPGRGVLTEKLCQTAKQVIAFEIDNRLLSTLSRLQQKYPNLQIINADFNKINWRQHLPSNCIYKIVANIPYHVTGLIFRNIFQVGQTLPQCAVLMIQYEVAKKIVPDEHNLSILSNLITSYGQPKIVCRVSKNSFRPIPQVDSAILAIDNIQVPDFTDFEDYFRLVKIGFSSRRKTILNNLSAGLKLPKEQVKEILAAANLDSDRRAQTISQSEWKKLYYTIEKESNSKTQILNK